MQRSRARTLWYRVERSTTMPFYEVLKKLPVSKRIRPDIAGIMGAFGAALIARERHEEGYQTSMLSIDEINAPTF